MMKEAGKCNGLTMGPLTIIQNMNLIYAPIALLIAAALTTQATAGGPKVKMENPDFTQGGAIPAGADHDWTLGATGLRGWMFSANLSTSDARQIAITEVAKGSPADGLLKTGDVILGVGGKSFSYDPRTEFGKALTLAEAAGGDLCLTRWQSGKTEEIKVKLPVLGSYSATAPYACVKSKRILEHGCEALAKRMAESQYRPEPITRSLNALALLASGDPKYLPLVRREAEWAENFSTNGFKTWYYGYVVMLLAEYKMATGDASFASGLRRLALEAANGQSAVGSWGHKFATPEGQLRGYGMMNAPGLPLTIALVMAREAGVKNPAIDLAIERSAKLLRFYIGKGCVPYGDHAPWMQTHDDNGKNGMAAVLFNLLDEPQGVEFFSRMSLASHGAERDCGHTGNFWNMTWAMPGVAQAGPQATGAWMKEFGAWSYDLARCWDGTFRHQGPPEMKKDKTADCDSTGAYLIAYAMPLKKIYLTGKRASKVAPLSASQAKQIVDDGGGWASNDRNSFYDKLSEQELLTRLSNWSPVVRERAAIAIGRSKDAPVSVLVKMLGSTALESRLGACQALAQLKGKAAPAVPTLRKTLRADDLWLRIQAAQALAAIGKPALEAVPELLEILTQVDTKKDPRGMQQRFFCFALFDAREGMLGHSLEGVNREQLYKAVRAGLSNQDGRARSTIASIYQQLSTDEIKPLLPAIYQAVIQPAPSGEMFADGIRMEGLRVMASNRVEEGIQACVNYARAQNPWGSEKRTDALMKILCRYGASAKPMIPALKRIADDFAKGEPDFPKAMSLQKAATVREAIRVIDASSEHAALIRIQAAGSLNTPQRCPVE